MVKFPGESNDPSGKAEDNGQASLGGTPWSTRTVLFFQVTEAYKRIGPLDSNSNLTIFNQEALSAQEGTFRIIQEIRTGVSIFPTFF